MKVPLRNAKVPSCPLYLRLLFLRSLRKPPTDVFQLHFPSYIYLSIDQNPGYFVYIGDEMLPSYIRGF